jgi:hypothetical protein
LVQLLAGKRALKNKWVYKLKEEGGEKRYKAGLVVKGFAQKKGIDFDEIFSPVVKMTSVSIRSHSWIAAGAEPDAHQFNVTFCLMR